MDYEKAYKVALEKARQIHDSPNASTIRKEWVEDMFPCLAESEDERIRKELIFMVKFALNDKSALIPGGKTTKEDALAWLKDLPNRFNLQPKQELDEKIQKELYEYFRQATRK